MVYPDVELHAAVHARFHHAVWPRQLHRGADDESRAGTWRGFGFAKRRRLAPCASNPAPANFADQAVIAIENARLFNETQEALERQTATSEILRVISHSPTDPDPVFESIVGCRGAVVRCDLAVVLLCDGDVYEHTAAATAQGPMDLPPGRLPIDPASNFPSRAIVAKETLHLPDWSRIELPEHERNIRAAFGVNSTLYLPLVREAGECIGVIAVAGTRPNSFGPKEIAQAESFRDQAVIAIENARLFNETQRALERQTATSEILKVIAASPSESAPVFEAIAHTAKRLLDGYSSVVWRFEGEIGISPRSRRPTQRPTPRCAPLRRPR